MRNSKQNGRPGQKQNSRSPQRGGKPQGRKTAPRRKPMRPSAPKQQISIDDSGLIRLNKLIAQSGVCSRREADSLIESGVIEVNGVIVTELGYKVSPDDKVAMSGQTLTTEKKVYILLNKPKDYLTTSNDPQNRRTVFDLIKNATRERVFSVGRLDRMTTGVLLFTNDGGVAEKLTHPSNNKKKIYQAELHKNITALDLKKIADGLQLEDGFIQPDAISYASPTSKSVVGIEIHSGRNRIVRRIFEHLGYKVTKLDRVYYAGLTKKNLPRGKWRFLTEKEIGVLKQGAYE